MYKALQTFLKTQSQLIIGITFFIFLLPKKNISLDALIMIEISIT